jgi:hypothetical protein
LWLILKQRRHPKVFLILLVITALSAAQAETTFTIEYGGKKYEFHVSERELQATPSWAPDQETPPLSPRRAIELARNQLGTLMPNATDWRLYDVTLRPVDDRWIYLITFMEPLRGGNAQQVSAGVQLVVLMNGVAVTPRVSP